MDASLQALKFYIHMRKYLHLAEHPDVGVQDLLPYVRPGGQVYVDGHDDQLTKEAPNRLMRTVEQLSRTLSASGDESTDSQDLDFALVVLEVLKPHLPKIRTITFHKAPSEYLLRLSTTGMSLARFFRHWKRLGA